MTERVRSVYTHVAAVVTGFVAFLMTLVVVLEFKYPNLERVGFADVHPVVVALSFCGLLSGVVAFLRPAHWRSLAVLVSSSFWGFFALIFCFFLYNGRLDWVPLGQAVLVVIVATVGALLGRWLSLAARKQLLG